MGPYFRELPMGKTTGYDLFTSALNPKRDETRKSFASPLSTVQLWQRRGWRQELLHTRMLLRFFYNGAKPVKG